MSVKCMFSVNLSVHLCNFGVGLCVLLVVLLVIVP